MVVYHTPYQCMLFQKSKYLYFYDTVYIEAVIRDIMYPYAGILAIDERPGTIHKRFKQYGVPPTTEVRKIYRKFLLETKGIEDYISAVIFSQDIFGADISGGKTFSSYTYERNMLPGIKIDEGTAEVKDTDERITLGIENIEKKLEEYKLAGAYFAKWRCVFHIGKNTPSTRVIEKNTHDLALYARACLTNNIVPIIEPEILMEGDHSFLQTAKVHSTVMNSVFYKLQQEKIDPSHVILKTGMVLPGTRSTEVISSARIAEKTVHSLCSNIPESIGGVVFLSGGQSAQDALIHLDDIARHAKQINAPFPISFSYGRALQEDTLRIWRGRARNIEKAKQAFLETVRKNGYAREGLLEEYLLTKIEKIKKSTM